MSATQIVRFVLLYHTRIAPRMLCAVYLTSLIWRSGDPSPSQAPSRRMFGWSARRHATQRARRSEARSHVEELHRQPQTAHNVISWECSCVTIKAFYSTLCRRFASAHSLPLAVRSNSTLYSNTRMCVYQMH